ncbi:Phage protein Gp37/Gp68 [Isobaculum melis]|uniref:Phage protein Gp37/Gp68 n=2 Tax=Isobaculum melis TaxID=142588 RepID=A0A1H9Q3B6_9LACT|nr:Phage protein Gp37/Gp68 [Isobaculum melis]
MYALDAQRDKKGSDIYQVKQMFDWPLKKDRSGQYLVPSGSTIRVCMTSDFFLEEADCWRDEVWDIIRKRSDVFFFILTKRIHRAKACFPKDWGAGWENVWLNVSVENQRTAEQRIPLLLATPAKHKGIMLAPLLEAVTINEYLENGQIAHVIVGGENYHGARPLHYEWVEALYLSCANQNVNFEFIETGNHFIKAGKDYHLPKWLQAEQAKKSGLEYRGRKVEVALTAAPLNESLPLFEMKAKSLCDSCTYKNKCSTVEKSKGCQLKI